MSIMCDNVYYKINYIRSTYKAASNSSDESDDLIQVFVKYLGEKVIMLHVEASDTISNLKKITKNKEGIPPQASATVLHEHGVGGWQHHLGQQHPERGHAAARRSSSWWWEASEGNQTNKRVL